MIEKLRREHYPLHFTITMTTRPARDAEMQDVHYRFVDSAEFERVRVADGLLESASVHGFDYGTPAEDVRQALAAGSDVLLKIDVQGAKKVKARVPEAILIFIGPASLEELAARLAARGSESPATLARRVADAAGELACLTTYDYVVVNRDGCLDQTVATVKSIVSAERARVRPRGVDLG